MATTDTDKLHWRKKLGLALVAGLMVTACAPEEELESEASSDSGPVDVEDAIDTVTYSMPREEGTMTVGLHGLEVEDSITRYDLDDAVEYLGGESEDEDVIVLETDILFSPNEWELPEVAPTRTEELVEEVPEGASVNVHGHTDSLPVDETQYDFDNQELSENRAQAVADVLSDVRPDLELTVEGFGDSEPAVTEDEDDPDTFAANRRVEIRYGD
ncbi:OmpA family protein [Nesterenkonia sp. MY13]|uniref:OmpA family protein n=1 Tax=Nesterenkonia sedimenti TaxID=1463632 RepID=A0A7X8TM64_9MICC|nr:OmpA family protein [Nesterenkonia sedimenti]NLS11101.1 OmpA family protein [Nesterenkonia sedimenti]